MPVVIKAVCIAPASSLTVGRSYEVSEVIRNGSITHFALTNDKHEQCKYAASFFKYEVINEANTLPSERV